MLRGRRTPVRAVAAPGARRAPHRAVSARSHRGPGPSVSGRPARLWPPSCHLAWAAAHISLVYLSCTLMYLAAGIRQVHQQRTASRLQAAAGAPSGLTGSSGTDRRRHCPRPPWFLSGASGRECLPAVSLPCRCGAPEARYQQVSRCVTASVGRCPGSGTRKTEGLDRSYG